MKRILVPTMLASILALASACNPVLGDRCNPQLFEDECGDGNACVYPSGCGVAYCCPPAGRITASSPAHCMACPADDAGTVD